MDHAGKLVAAEVVLIAVGHRHGHLLTAWTATDDCAARPAAGAASMVGGPAAYWQSWTYDATGNRRTQTDHDLTGVATNDTVATYSTPEAGQGPAHALASVVKDTPGGPDTDTTTDYTYDASGNIDTRTSRAGTDDFTYDSEGKLTQLATTGTADPTKYVYDASGNLLIRRDAGATVLFTGDQELTLKTGADKAEGSRYVALGGQQIAVHTADAKGDRVDYVVSDRQNTGQLQIDAGTQAVTRRQYKPFGEVRTAAADWQGTKGYVGGQQDDATGLTNLGAREYDPAVGRFLNPDPLISAGDPESWNAYAYASNSPVTLSDPSGLCPADLCGIGTPYGDGSGRIITDGPVDPGGPNRTTCHKGRCSDGLAVGDDNGGRGHIGNTTQNVQAEAASSQVKAMESAAAACTKHSFRGDTHVLLADGTTRPIADLRPGDEVTSTDPQTEVTAAEKVERHIVTKDDKEFTDLVLTPEPTATHATGPVVAPAATPHPVKLTTTWHHPFWDSTHHRWTDARNLKPGTELQRPGGATAVVSAVVSAVRNYRASGVTYDLTVGVVHTYYVLAGATPVLVHNCDVSLSQAEADTLRVGPHANESIPCDRAGSDSGAECSYARQSMPFMWWEQSDDDW
ncbi:RHS repeat-associated core domain-containing protein [Streptomyces sp. NPDC059651]|uniref:RHS repeat-associated core domain-containing protein n=1 Tax=Streptomyces sp. NPDC059651 TaxID=3346897 RepID=UPI00369FA01D